MRLDHLLSKEHLQSCTAEQSVDDGLAEAISDAYVIRWLLMGGSLTSIGSQLPACVLVGGRIISTYCWVLREHVSVFSFRKVTIRFGCQADRITFGGGHGAGGVRGGCVV